MTDKSSARRREILLAALGCFSEHGVEATTIDMIRAASGASVGSLYHRFGNKEGIAAEVFMEGLRDFRAHLAAAVAEVGGLEQAVRATVYANVDWISANPDWARFLFAYRSVLVATDREAEQRAETQEAQDVLFARMAAMLGPDRAIPWPPAVYRSLVVGPVHDYARQWLGGRKMQPIAELREVFAEAAWRSLGLD